MLAISRILYNLGPVIQNQQFTGKNFKFFNQNNLFQGFIQSRCFSSTQQISSPKKTFYRVNLGRFLLGSFLFGNLFLMYQIYRHEIEVHENLKTVPRTVRTMFWAGQAAREYSKLINLYKKDENQEEYQQKLSELHSVKAKELLNLCETNGGVYVKAGQFASTIESVPEEYREVLSSLQDDAPMRSFEEIKFAIEKELKKPIKQIFKEFNQEPAAAASIAQVHKAVRADNGEQVAVKVQYPGIDKAIKADMFTLKQLSQTAERFFIEAANNKEFVRQIQHPKVRCPVVHDDLTTTHVLTMEWIDGVKITDIEGMKKLKINPHDVAMDMLNVFATMTFVKGYVHGDPHAGNEIVRPLKNGSYQIVLLDHGHYIHMSQHLREQYCQLWCSFVLGDDDASLKVAMRIAGEKGRLLPEILNPKKGQKRKSVAAFSKALQQFPRPLVDTIRVNGIVRQIVTELGASLTDRLYMNGGGAVLGLPQTNFDGENLSDFQFWVLQTKVGLKVGLLRWGIRLGSAIQRIKCWWLAEEFKVRVD